MSTPYPVVFWKEVRNQELSDIVTRRLQVEPSDPARAAAIRGRVANEGRDLGGLSATLEEWLDVVLLEGRRLLETVRRWQKEAGLPVPPTFDEASCKKLLGLPLFVGLREVLTPRSLEEEAAKLPEGVRQSLEAQWLASGWVGPEEKPLTGAARGPFQRTLDERARRGLEEAIRRGKAERIRGLLHAELQSRVPLGSLAAGPRKKGAAGVDPDPVEAEGQKAMDAEFRGGAADPDVVAALEALILEALMCEEVSGSLVGLALSGGGIRSASFNLGVLQSLQENRLLRNVDYLSTVSGGGYVGSFLSSLIHKRDVHLDPDKGKEPPLAPTPEGKQPERVVKLVRSGSFLNHPLLHASRYLLGVVLNNLVLFSALICACAFVALVWRGMDMHFIADPLRYYSFGWVKDWNRPFLPALTLLLVWLARSTAYLWRHGATGQPPHAHRLLVVTGAFFLIGAAVWLATPNLDIPLLTSRSYSSKLELLSLGNAPVLVLLAVALFGVVPFLKPQSFLASGLRKEGGQAKQILFRVLSLALLGGIPFFFTFVLARHGIAEQIDPTFIHDPEKDHPGRHAVARPIVHAYSPDSKTDRDASTHRWWLHETDIQFDRWSGFWERLQAQAEQDDGSIGHHVWRRLESVHCEVDATVRAPEYRDAIERVPIPLDDEAREVKKGIIDALNEHVIADTSFMDDVSRNGDTIKYVRKRAESMLERRRLLSLLDRYEQRRLLPEDHPQLNRLLLEAYYGYAVWERAVVRRSVVVDRDQWFRCGVLGASLAAALLASLFVGLNSTSLHGIYRNQLARVYIEPVGEEKPDLPLHELDTTSKGGPYHLISGTLDKGGEQRDDARRTAHFLFSRRFCGSLFTGYVPTKDYLGGALDLAGAMAISGAAFSPARQGNQFVAFLMLVLNLRLGQWLPSPRHPWRVRHLPVARLLWDLASRKGALERRYWFVTDGGHSENLGLGPLLRRECKLMIVSDAGQDPDYGFDDFVQLYRHARIQGVRFQTLDQSGFIRMDPLLPDKDTRKSRHRYVLARVEYPGHGEQRKWGLLIYIKPSFVGDEAVDLTRYRGLNPEFPHDPTVNQWFDEDQVESYRELGAWIGQRVCEVLGEAMTKCGQPAEVFDRFVNELAEQGQNPGILASNSARAVSNGSVSVPAVADFPNPEQLAAPSDIEVHVTSNRG